MPVSRKRSCAACRGAKARCSLAMPRCSRCIERGLLCEYTNAGFHSAIGIPYSRPSPRVSLFGEENEAAGPSDYTPASAFGNLFGDSLDLCQSAVSSEVGACDTGISASSNPVTAFSPCWNGHSVNVGSVAMGDFETTSQSLQSIASAATLTPDLLDLSDPESAAVSSTPFPAPSPSNDSRLASRRTWSPQGSGTMRKRQLPKTTTPASWLILVGQIESYPKMLIHGLSLPPFIHSRCSLEDEGGRPFSCQEKMCHQCLPEILGICTALVRLFYAKTEANSAFVWRTIYTEQARLARDIHTFDRERVLEALQAVCIYTILQSQDPDSLENNDSKSMVATLSKLAGRLHEEHILMAHHDTLDHPLSRREWLYQENLCRTFCFLILVECLLEVMIGRSEGPCTGYGSIPLPCGRDLWEVESTPEWSRRYRDALRRRKCAKRLNVRDLVLVLRETNDTGVRSGSDGGSSVEAGLADAATWCQGVDQFGMLLWIALGIKGAFGAS